MTTLVQDKHAELLRLCREFHVRELGLFGSAATDEFDPERSDLDFLVSFGDCTPIENAHRYFGLLAALQDLFMRRIDLVEREAIEKPRFLREMEKTYVPLYAA